MSRLFSFLLAVFCIANSVTAQTTYTWQAGAVGDYQDPTNWLPVRTVNAATDILAFNATTPISVVNVPNQTIGAIRILSGTSSVKFATNSVTNVLTLSAATPLVFSTSGEIFAGDLLTIALSNTAAFSIASGTFGIAPYTGGKITINSDITLAGGTLDFDVAGTGGTTINTGGSIIYTSGTFSCANASAIVWANGSEYQHNVSGTTASAIPTSSWMGGSTCSITGFNSGVVAPAGLGGSVFANFTWNCPAQMGDVDLDLGGLTLTIQGTLTVLSTGASPIGVRFTGTNPTTITAGVYVQTGGKLVLQTGTATTTLQVTGAFSQGAGGTIDFVGGTGGGTATLNLKGALTKAGTWTSSTSNTASQMNVQFSGIVPQAVTVSGTWTMPAGRCNIINTNTDPSGVSLNSTGGGGALKVINNNSVQPAMCLNGGNFTGAGSILYSGTGAGLNNFTLSYNGVVPQVASSVEFPNLVSPFTSPFNLIINNATGVSFPANFDRWIRGTLNMQTGNLSLGAANRLTLSNNSLGSQLVYSSGFISSGTLRRFYPSSALPTTGSLSSRFPLGIGINDRSLYLFFSSTSITAGDTIGVSHQAIVNASAITSFADNSIVVDKRTNTFWQVSIGAGMNLGAATISLQTQCTNIGSVDNISTLRLTDGTAALGTLITATGTTDAPLIGKSGLSIADINSKPLYVGSDNTNALQIVTFTWTGVANTNWANAGNWTGGVGYPSSSTEIAIVNAPAPNMPVIASGTNVSIYQLTVVPGATLTMTGTGVISVFDSVDYRGNAVFAASTKFIYAGSATTQYIRDLPYGTLGVAGSAPKILPPTTTVTGDFEIAGTEPTFGTGTFVYAASAEPVQRIAANISSKYYNLTITGDRGGRPIRMGNGVTPNVIDIANTFTVTATNYTVIGLSVNTVNFSSTGTQVIPGFTYGSITNNTAGGGLRVLDPLGSTDAAHAIVCTNYTPILPAASNTITGSKVKYVRTGNTIGAVYGLFHDLEISGNLNGGILSFMNNNIISISGVFTVSAFNYVRPTNGTSRIFYNGTGNQTITPFVYDNLSIAAGNRTVTLGTGGNITVKDQLLVSTQASAITPGTFTAGNGIIVAGSTVNFFQGSSNIPVLPPAVSGGDNYNNLSVNGGIRVVAGDLKIGGNVSVVGSDASVCQLNLGNNVSDRTISIAGNFSVSGTSAGAAPTCIVDFNSASRLVNLRLGGNLSIAGTSQFLTGNDPQNLKGYLRFVGVNQQYTNTATFKNKYINYIIGDGTNPTTLTLNSPLHLTRSGALPFSDSITVSNNATIDFGSNNLVIGIDTLPGTHKPVFSLGAGGTLVTTNTGIAPNTAIEGVASNGTNGSISSSANLTKVYNNAANYVLNGATVNPFPAAIFSMSNCTIGAPISLNKAIDVDGTLDLASFTLTQASNDLEFSGLTSTTGAIYADQASRLAINGANGSVGTLRFALPGGNTTGQFTINRPVTVPLNSDLTISKAVLSGNLVTGTPSSILDINGNTLTVNGAISGSGTLSGSHTSNLTLGGAAGTVRFTLTKQILKNLTLVSNATATLGSALDITGGLTPGNEGTVSVTGTALLTTNGYLTLKSTADGTARVAQGATTGGYISGNVTVERYIGSDRSWRFLGTPGYGQTIKQAWQENQPAAVDGNPGFGTRITAKQTNWAANGFDGYSPNNSMLAYNPSSNNFSGIANTSLSLTSAGGNSAYMLFVRGDRSVPAVTGAPSTATVLRIKGNLFQGNQAPLPVLAGKFAAVSNNYASAIDFLTLPKTNLDNSYTVWDPRMPGANDLGAWVTFSASTAIPWQPIPSAAGASYTPNVANTRIESGQAFMVHSSGAAGSVTINESNKISGSRLVQRPFTPAGNRQSITTNLYNTNSGTPLVCDGNAVVFSSEFSNELNGDDAFKIPNFGDNFGLARDGQVLSVDARAPVSDADTIFFDMSKIREESYRMELIADNFDQGQEAYLEDKYLNVTTQLSLNGVTNYDFTVSSDAASAAAARFRVVFKNSPASPVSFTSVAATQVATGISVEWKVKNEVNITRYEVERSSDGVHFTAMYNTNATQNTGGNAAYSWLDGAAVNGDVYYRIKVIDTRSNIKYSSVVKVTIFKGKPGFTVFPNPVTDGAIGVQFNGQAAGTYAVRLISTNGQLVTRNNITHTGGMLAKKTISVMGVMSGNYQLEITAPDNSITVVPVLIQGK